MPFCARQAKQPGIFALFTTGRAPSYTSLRSDVIVAYRICLSVLCIWTTYAQFVLSSSRFHIEMRLASFCDTALLDPRHNRMSSRMGQT
ncbi:hypothetical protein BDZ89DRAFT_359829 [Hymenopellis radicata]|nr:hypothetical protein BDZ89DRAFT_359829 [Hymenopellis radicata]